MLRAASGSEQRTRNSDTDPGTDVASSGAAAAAAAARWRPHLKAAAASNEPRHTGKTKGKTAPTVPVSVLILPLPPGSVRGSAGSDP